MRRHALFLLVLLAASCSPPGQERQIWMSQFIGRPEQELIAALGVPSRSYETEGVTFLAFTESRLDLMAPMSLYGPPFWGFSSGFPAQVIQWTCETTVAVSGGIVRNFSFRGNAC